MLGSLVACPVLFSSTQLFCQLTRCFFSISMGALSANCNYENSVFLVYLIIVVDCNY